MFLSDFELKIGTICRYYEHSGSNRSFQYRSQTFNKRLDTFPYQCRAPSSDSQRRCLTVQAPSHVASTLTPDQIYSESIRMRRQDLCAGSTLAHSPEVGDLEAFGTC